MTASSATDPYKVSILVVDDDERIRQLCMTYLQKLGHEVSPAASADQALELAHARKFDVLLTDIRMPGTTGDVLIEQLTRDCPDTAAVIMTGYPTMELAIDAVGNGVYEFITKPFKLTELRQVFRKVVRRRGAETSRSWQQFARELLSMEKQLGEEFDLQAAVQDLIKASAPAGMDDLVTSSPSRQAAMSPVEMARARGLELGKPEYVVLCEPIPRDKEALKSAPNYHHFRTIYAAHRVLNNQMLESDSPREVKLVVASHSADIPKYFRRHTDQIRCVIFGPNLPRLSDATVRMTASSARNRHVVVCYNPDQVNFTWENLEELGATMKVWGCRAAADPNEVRTFWSQYFTRDLKPLMETPPAAPDGSGDGRSALTPEEIQELLERDQDTVELLPGFPHVCKRVIEAIDAQKRYPEVAAIVEADGALQASMIRTANLARYGSRQRIETLTNALSMIGMEECKKIVLGNAMNDLVNKVDAAGFDTKAFYLHSATVGFLAQLLNLDMDNPSSSEREILQGLRLPSFVEAALKHHRLWKKFNRSAHFEPFTAGVLHDMGKIVNTVCYSDLLPMILYEVERTQWKGSLVASEASVVGGFQHPMTGAALLERWELFPALVEPIRTHHTIGPESRPQAVLLGLANCLSKSTHPFPAAIAIDDDYRKSNLRPAEDETILVNPLIARAESLARLYAEARTAIGATPQEVDSGQYTQEHVEALIATSRRVVDEHAEVSGVYLDLLVDQNPEILDIVTWLDTPVEELLALELLLRDAVVDRVNALFQGTGTE